MKTIFFGASHTVAMAKCLGHFSATWDDVIDRPVPISDDQGECTGYLVMTSPKAKLFEHYLAEGQVQVRINDRFSAQLRALDSPDNLCYFAIGGNEHNSLFMVRHAQPFDFHDDRRPDQLIQGRQIVPRQVVEQRLRAALPHVERELRLASTLMPAVRKAFVMPPPPVPSEDYLLRYPEGFRFEGRGVEDRWVRLKIYDLYRQELAQICDRHHLALIGPPSECVDDEGFLRPEYWFEATHATPSYYRSIVRPH